jgi:hypothetical protein
MNEHPILFSTPMVQAILDGRKTMTRRMTDLEVINKMPSGWKPVTILFGKIKNVFKNVFRFESIKSGFISDRYCRYGQPGDVLWVREKFACTIGQFDPETTLSYFADSFHWSFYPGHNMHGKSSCQWHDEDIAKEVKWKPSIHMFKDYARIWLQVEEIRVERLHDISEEDAKAEGIMPYYDEMVSGMRFTHQNGQLSNSFTAKEEFEKLWCKINGRESWEANPWVWVVEYKVLSTIGKPKTEPG